MARVMGGPNPGKGEAWNMGGPGPWEGVGAVAARPGGLTWPRVHNTSSGSRNQTNKGNRSKLYTNWVHWAVGKISSLLLEGMERHKCFVS